MTALPKEMEISFGPYQLEKANARLLRGNCPVPLAPKALDVLHYLATRSGRLVTKEELLAALWPDVLVSDASIKVCVREIRKALNDGAKRPTYIETVHRRGYRFIAAVRESSPPRWNEDTLTRGVPIAVARSAAPFPAAHALSARNADMQPLAAAPTRRQCVFISVDARGTQIIVF
jgi:DNA-binding winged helix-turn-helix (wHTH) protein